MNNNEFSGSGSRKRISDVVVYVYLKMFDALGISDIPVIIIPVLGWPLWRVNSSKRLSNQPYIILCEYIKED